MTRKLSGNWWLTPLTGWVVRLQAKAEVDAGKKGRWPFFLGDLVLPLLEGCYGCVKCSKVVAVDCPRRFRARSRLNNRVTVRLVRHPPLLASTERPSRNPMYTS